MNIHDKAIRLIEGGVVDIDSNWFRLKIFPDYYDDNSCMECNLDSICRYQHVEVCAECEAITRRKCCLLLAGTGR